MSVQMNRAVVTGAASMIGAALVARLAAAGCEVIAFVNPGTTRRASTLAEHRNVTVVPLPLDAYASEIEDKNHVNEIAACDVFYHLAWRATLGAARADKGVQQANVGYALDAVRLAHALGCSRFVGAGSQAEYGKLEGAFSATTPTAPITAYGAAKLEAGQRTREAAHELGMEHVWVRIGSVYGPGDNPGTVIMQAMEHAASGEPFACTPAEQLWDHLYCADAADALALIGSRGVDGRVYPLGSGVAEPLREHILLAAQAVDPAFVPDFGALPYPDGQVMLLQADIAQLCSDTGFAPRTEFARGAQLSAQWFLQTRAQRGSEA